MRPLLLVVLAAIAGAGESTNDSCAGAKDGEAVCRERKRQDAACRATEKEQHCDGRRRPVCRVVSPGGDCWCRCTL